MLFLENFLCRTPGLVIKQERQPQTWLEGACFCSARSWSWNLRSVTSLAA
jgi:hypothetical protein